MSCCGKKRMTPGLVSPSAANTTPGGPANHNQARPPAGSEIRAAQFEYRGGRVLSVTGQGTGYQYRFIGHGARLDVDGRDRASLAAVPQLREVRG
jgi:hypothetical protein